MRRVDPQASAAMIRQLKDLPPLTTAVYRGGTYVVKNYPVTSFLYLLGMVLMMFATGMTVSEQAHEDYARLLESSEAETSALESAQMRHAQASQAYQSSRGFLGFGCNKQCQVYKAKFDKTERELKTARNAQYAALSEAKSKVGVFSMYAVQEARDLFWGTFAAGKGFAKRASMWDLLFMGIGSMGRDENMLAFVFRFAAQLLMNFTMGLIGALVAFVWYLWGLVRSYQPDPVTAVISFVLFTVAATSMVATYLFALYGTAGSAVYIMARTVAANMRIEGGEGGPQAPQGHIGGGAGGYGAGAAGGADDEGELRIGRPVRIRGLLSAQEYNGLRGRITGMEGDRYLVHLETGKDLKVRANNIDTHIE